ncbi:MAG: nuclear transport factor 2 family protein [Aeromicrobium sp.]|uniref:YybH family protein n=1 Tax=Aeromicrobium sp. TaxID=1871063 RepID=UPI003C3D5817
MSNQHHAPAAHLVAPTAVGTHPSVAAWLQAFAAAVRDRNFSGARGLFWADAEGFGTVANRWNGIDQLEAEQWQGVWGRTADFDFDLDAARIVSADDLTLVISTWSSDGVGSDGTMRRRVGRATIGLVAVDGDLRAVHTHFSMVPGTPA